MVDKCKPIYKNLNSRASFSEQRAATVQLMEQVCQNEEYLYQNVQKLDYLSPPAVRKRFNPVLIDESSSYGYQVNSSNTDDGLVENVVSFDSRISKQIKIDLSDLSMIDLNKSDCAFETMETGGVVTNKIVIPMESTNTLNSTCKNFDKGDGINSYWYVGFDKNKPYQIRPDWIADNFDSEIPSVCRAQTIVIPEGISTNENTGVRSVLESVSLFIQNNGTVASDWASPLFVQVFPVVMKNVQKTVWDKKKKKSVKAQGFDTIAFPSGNPKTALATATFNPSKTEPGFYNFVFDKQIPVNAGEKYAIVVSSPLSHWDHCPRIGGWGRNCVVKKDNGGDAFLSENNGRSWIRYGKNDMGVKDYKLGQLTPQDFAFQAHIRVYEEGYDTDETFYCYLKPICDNPIKSLYFTPNCWGDEGEDNDVDLVFKVSTDGKTWDKTIERNNHLVTFDRDENGEYPRTVFIRAELTTSNKLKSPYIKSMEILLDTELPKELYVRTHFYNPKLTPMLSANRWGRVYAPFDFIPFNSESINCNVEIIEENVSCEHFNIITVNELEYYLELEFDNKKILDESEIVDKNNDDRADYLINNPSVLHKLKQHNVYVKPYTLNEVEYLLSFEDYDSEGDIILGGLKLSNSPAYPIKECVIQPLGNTYPQSYGEWYDYDVDYNNDILTLTESVLNDMPVGALSVSYNKVIIQDLSLDEVGDRVNPENGLKEHGLILDYYKEEILVSDAELETRRIPLRMVPLDPVREVKIIRGGDEFIVYEDSDFTVDYANKELIFNIVNINNGSSQLELNDIVSVVYTPNIEDTGIAIGYYASRSNLNHQLRIKPNYIEYK